MKSPALPGFSMALYGYARVSTLDQNLGIQRAALKAAGCDVIRAEKQAGHAATAGPSYRFCSISCGQAIPLSSHGSTDLRGRCGIYRTSSMS